MLPVNAGVASGHGRGIFLAEIPRGELTRQGQEGQRPCPAIGVWRSHAAGSPRYQAAMPCQTAPTSDRMIRAMSAQSSRLKVSGRRMSMMPLRMRSLRGIGADGA